MNPPHARTEREVKLIFENIHEGKSFGITQQRVLNWKQLLYDPGCIFGDRNYDIRTDRVETNQFLWVVFGGFQ